MGRCGRTVVSEAVPPLFVVVVRARRFTGYGLGADSNTIAAIPFLKKDDRPVLAAGLSHAESAPGRSRMAAPAAMSGVSVRRRSARYEKVVRKQEHLKHFETQNVHFFTTCRHWTVSVFLDIVYVDRI